MHGAGTSDRDRGGRLYLHSDGPIDTPGAEKMSEWIKLAFLNKAKKLVFELS